MAVTDWRAWVAQEGGRLAGVAPVMFPGVLPIPLLPPDFVDGELSIPTYPNVPTQVNAIDPFWAGTWPDGGGWVAPMEHPEDWTGLPGKTFPSGAIMRPAIPGLTSP